MSVPEANKRQLDIELDQLEAQIGELRILFEQYFVELLPHPPDELKQKTSRNIRRLLRSPFKNSQAKFRLRTLISKYQTYATYWERVQKQKEEGTYCKDKFKADLRCKINEEKKREINNPDKGFKELFRSYETAIRNTELS